MAMFGLGQNHLYKQVYADDTLTEAWRKVRTGTDIAGVDSITVAQFQARLFANLKALQNDLHRRRYTPQPVKRLSIPKPDGTKRPLGILTVRDRIVQRAVLLVIDPLFDADFEECSHGFRKGRSVHTALTQVSRYINLGYGWIVDFDIASCFDMINTKLFFKFIKERLKNDELRRLIQAWLEVEKGFDYLGERFFIRHTGHGEEAVMVRPVKSVPVQAVIPPHRRLQAAPATHQDNGEEDVWEPSI